MQKKKKILVVGGGISGLATAALLAKEGYAVTIIEKNATLGGRARVMKEKGFTFDMGPSWYMMPEVFARYFRHFGKEVADFYSLRKLDPHYRVYWGKNDRIDISSSIKRQREVFETLSPGSTKEIIAFLNDAKKLYDLAIEQFLYTDYADPRKIFGLLRHVGLVPKYFLQTVASTTQRISSNKRIQQLLSYHAVFLGASPREMPGLYGLMAHVDLVEGIYYPMGGMGKIVDALVAVCLSYGVTIKKGEEVTKMDIKKNNITSVRTTKQVYDANIVVMSADYAYAETRLLPKRYQTYPASYWKKRHIAPSMFLMYLGVKGSFSSLTHHTFYFSQDWDTHFQRLQNGHTYPLDPSYYISKPTATDNTVAPKGHENLFVLVPIPSGMRETASMRKNYAAKIVTHIEQTMGIVLKNNIVYQKIYSTQDFTNDYNAYFGTALGLSHTFMQTAFLRPGIRSKKVKNLFYVGQYTLPGTGVPMCLISAELVTRKIRQYEK